MSLEIFSNELFLDIFDYLSTIDLIKSFYNLNTHINNLLFLHLKIHSLNFQSSSKSDFDLICQKYLPSILNHIKILRLSDDDDTPNQIDLFFSYNLSLSKFSYLQSLTIYQISSIKSLTKILYQLIELPNLIYLKITRYFILFNEIYDLEIINSINHLSKLIYCYLDITNDDEYNTLISSIQSSTLKSLSIPYFYCNRNQLIHLIKYIPNLQVLNACINDFSSVITTTRLLSIKKLKLHFNGSYNSLKNLLIIFPNLIELKIEMISCYIDGYQWKEIIENYLRFLINLQFKMSVVFSNKKNLEEKINELFHSFSTEFWIVKHQWFIECYYDLTDLSSIIQIYTLPYSFKNFLYLNNSQLKSTNQNFSYDYVKNLYCYQINFTYSNQISFNNIEYLDIRYPFNELFEKIILKLNQIKFLKITLNDYINENDRLKLEYLFNNLTNLYSLKYFSWSSKNIFLFNLKNPSIYQFDLRSPNLYYNSQQCEQLIQSSIGQQCQILFIHLLHRLDIFQLISHMNNLRSLIIKCFEEKNQNLIQLLDLSLPLTYTREILDDDYIRLWIR